MFSIQDMRVTLNRLIECIKRMGRTMMEERDLGSANLLLVDGIVRSGKFWLANMLIHYENMEHMQSSWMLEMCSYMNKLGELSDNATISLLQNEVEKRMLEMKSGRYINFRLADSSSIYRSPNLHVYLERICGKGGSLAEIADEIKKNKKLFVFITHDWLCNIDTCFKALPQMRVIRMQRNPIDLVYAWHIKKMGNANTYHGRIEINNTPLPWFAYNWFEE